MDETLILASASAVRKNLLVAAGLQFCVQPALVDEDAIKRRYKIERRSAADCTLALAEAKARELGESHRDALVVGADQILACDAIGSANPLTLPAPVLSSRFCAGEPTSSSPLLVLFLMLLGYGIRWSLQS